MRSVLIKVMSIIALVTITSCRPCAASRNATSINAFRSTVINGFTLASICMDFKKDNARYPTVGELRQLLQNRVHEPVCELFTGSGDIQEIFSNNGGWYYCQNKEILTFNLQGKIYLGNSGAFFIPNEINFIGKGECIFYGVDRKTADELAKNNFTVFSYIKIKGIIDNME